MFFLKAKRAGLLGGAAMAALGLFGADGALAQEAVSTAQPGAAAAEDPRDVRIRALEHAVEDLSAEIQDLKTSQGAGLKDVRNQVSALPQVTFANGRPQLASADGNFK